MSMIPAACRHYSFVPVPAVTCRQFSPRASTRRQRGRTQSNSVNPNIPQLFPPDNPPVTPPTSSPRFPPTKKAPRKHTHEQINSTQKGNRRGASRGPATNNFNIDRCDRALYRWSAAVGESSGRLTDECGDPRPTRPSARQRPKRARASAVYANKVYGPRATRIFNLATSRAESAESTRQARNSQCKRARCLTRRPSPPIRRITRHIPMSI